MDILDGISTAARPFEIRCVARKETTGLWTHPLPETRICEISLSRISCVCESLCEMEVLPVEKEHLFFFFFRRTNVFLMLARIVQPLLVNRNEDNGSPEIDLNKKAPRKKI